MKRYLVFVGDSYYPGGGMQDFVLDTDDLRVAMETLEKISCDYYKWGHIYDQEERKEVESI